MLILPPREEGGTTVAIDSSSEHKLDAARLDASAPVNADHSSSHSLGPDAGLQSHQSCLARSSDRTAAYPLTHSSCDAPVIARGHNNNRASSQHHARESRFQLLD